MITDHLGLSGLHAVNIYMVVCCDVMACSFLHVNTNVPMKSAPPVFGVSTHCVSELYDHNSVEYISIIFIIYLSTKQ